MFYRNTINTLLSTCRKVCKPWITTVTTKQFHRDTGTRKMQRKDWIHSHTHTVGRREAPLAPDLIALDASVTRPIQRLRSNKRNSGPLFGMAGPEKTSPWRINNWTQEWRGGFLVWWKLIPFPLYVLWEKMNWSVHPSRDDLCKPRTQWKPNTSARFMLHGGET